MYTHRIPPYSMTVLSLEIRRIVLAVHLTTFLSVISPFNDQCDHRLGLTQKLHKTSTTQYFMFTVTLTSHTVVLSCKSGRRH